MSDVACALLDRIAASPDEAGGDGGDDAAHLVLADQLMQLGHAAWGELIVLACGEARGTLTRAQRHRLFLLRGNPRAWLGPIKAVTFDRRVARGLIVATGVDARRRGMIAAARGHLAWRTVRDVRLHEAAAWAGHFRAHDEVAALLGELPALAVLRGATAETVLGLGSAAPLPVRELELFLYADSGGPGYYPVHGVLGGPVFAEVRRLALRAGLYRGADFRPAELGWWLREAPIGERLEALDIGYLPGLAVWQHELVFSARPVLRACTVMTHGGRFELARGAGEAWSRLTVETTGERPDALAALWARLAELSPGALGAVVLRLDAGLAARPELGALVARLGQRQPAATVEVVAI